MTPRTQDPSFLGKKAGFPPNCPDHHSVQCFMPDQFMGIHICLQVRLSILADAPFHPNPPELAHTCYSGSTLSVQIQKKAVFFKVMGKKHLARLSYITNLNLEGIKGDDSPIKTMMNQGSGEQASVIFRTPDFHSPKITHGPCFLTHGTRKGLTGIQVFKQMERTDSNRNWMKNIHLELGFEWGYHPKKMPWWTTRIGQMTHGGPTMMRRKATERPMSETRHPTFIVFHLKPKIQCSEYMCEQKKN